MNYTLITGACGGLGRAFAEILASRGEALFLTGTSEERLNRLAEELHGKYPSISVKFRACDLREKEYRIAFFAHIREEGIQLNRLVYVAGVDTQMAFEKFNEEMLDLQIRVNFEGAVSCIRGFLACSPLDGNTEILTVGSMSAATPMPYFALYSATKKALEQFCIGLHEELKGRAKVTCVLPGGIPTRDDIRENILSHGFFGRISAKSPRSVAKISLRAVRKNRRKKVVGFWNKVIKFATAIVPTPLKMRIISRMWKRTEKDFYSVSER